MKFTSFSPRTNARGAKAVPPLTEAPDVARRCAKNGISGGSVSAVGRKNRLPAALLSLCLALSLAACGGSSAPSGAASAEATAPAAAEALPPATDAPAGAPESTAEPEAQELRIDPATAKAWKYESVGITLYAPEEYTEAKGIVEADAYDNIFGPGTYYLELDYVGIDSDWFAKAIADDATAEEAANQYSNAAAPVFVLLGIDGNRGADDLAAAYQEAAGDAGISAGDLTEVKKNGDITYFLYEDDFSQYVSALAPEYSSEYDRIAALTGAVLDSAEYYQPVGLYDALMGQKISFTTTDLDGNTVTSEELFANYDVVMVNVWATWCHWCIEELPELEQINNRLAARNCAIVGLLGDGTDEETVALGKSQLAEAGCTYLNLVPFDGWTELFPMDGWPTSFFFDSTGKMVSAPIVGAAISQYESKIDSILDGSDAGSDAGSGDGEAVAETSAANGENVYRIFVVDQNEEPVAGAMVQFCTTDTCRLGTTDENGLAVFDDPEGVYEVHILKAPSGYRNNETVYATPSVYSDLVIAVEKE